jgi:hypothetical protein
MQQWLMMSMAIGDRSAVKRAVLYLPGRRTKIAAKRQGEALRLRLIGAQSGGERLFGITARLRFSLAQQTSRDPR